MSVSGAASGWRGPSRRRHSIGAGPARQPRSPAPDLGDALPQEPAHEARRRRFVEREAHGTLRGLVPEALRGRSDRARRIDAGVALPGGVIDQRFAVEHESRDPVTDLLDPAGSYGADDPA